MTEPLTAGTLSALEPAIELADTTTLWIKERVSYAAAYNCERVLAWVYRPRNVTGPMQSVVMWAKDYRRTLDYLSTRSEFASTRIAYFGASWGGFLGGLIPAVEPRTRAVVLYIAGLGMETARPEVDPINFLPRIRQPVLMLNGRHDFFFPVETAQEPVFRLLGSPAADKKYLVYEGGHDVPRTELIKETLAWLDRYLGMVR